MGLPPAGVLRWSQRSVHPLIWPSYRASIFLSDVPACSAISCRGCGIFRIFQPASVRPAADNLILCTAVLQARPRRKSRPHRMRSLRCAPVHTTLDRCRADARGLGASHWLSLAVSSLPHNCVQNSPGSETRHVRIRAGQAAYKNGTLSDGQFSELQALQAEQADFIIDSARSPTAPVCTEIRRHTYVGDIRITTIGILGSGVAYAVARQSALLLRHARRLLRACVLCSPSRRAS